MHSHKHLLEHVEIFPEVELVIRKILLSAPNPDPICVLRVNYFFCLEILFSQKSIKDGIER